MKSKLEDISGVLVRKMIPATGWSAVFEDNTVVPLVCWVAIENISGIHGTIVDGDKVIFAHSKSGFKTYDFGYDDMLNS